MLKLHHFYENFERHYRHYRDISMPYEGPEGPLWLPSKGKILKIRYFRPSLENKIPWVDLSNRQFEKKKFPVLPWFSLNFSKSLNVPGFQRLSEPCLSIEVGCLVWIAAIWKHQSFWTKCSPIFRTIKNWRNFKRMKKKTNEWTKVDL